MIIGWVVISVLASIISVSAARQFSRGNLIMKFTKNTKIITIGHLPGHTTGKVKLLQEQGFTDVSSILSSIPVEVVKSTLSASPDSFFLVGGAMMQGFPDLMADLLSFIEKECPTIKVHLTVKTDFDEGVKFPPEGMPTEDEVNKSAVNICLRLLEQDSTTA
jgi:hypothetical protein